MAGSVRSIVAIVFWGVFLRGPVPLAPHSSPSPVVKVKLGLNVNSSFREGMPVVSPDRQTLYFIRENYVDEGLRSLMDSMPKSMDEKALKEWTRDLSNAGAKGTFKIDLCAGCED